MPIGAIITEASNNAVTQLANCASDQAGEKDNQPVASRPLPSPAVTSTFNQRDLLCQLLTLRSYPELSTPRMCHYQRTVMSLQDASLEFGDIHNTF